MFQTAAVRRTDPSDCRLLIRARRVGYGDLDLSGSGDPFQTVKESELLFRTQKDLEIHLGELLLAASTGVRKRTIINDHGEEQEVEETLPEGQDVSAPAVLNQSYGAIERFQKYTLDVVRPLVLQFKVPRVFRLTAESDVDLLGFSTTGRLAPSEMFIGRIESESWAD